MQTKLTATNVGSLKAGDYHDTIAPGLILRVGAKRRTWMIRYRRAGARKLQVLGRFPAMGLADARDAARDVQAKIDAGDDPAPARHAAPVHPTSPDLLTMGKLFDQWEVKRRREAVKTKTLTEGMRQLRRDIGKFRNKPARDFTKDDLKAIRDTINERGAVIMANRFLAMLSPVMDWAASEDLIAFNFVPQLKKAPERKRKRVLTAIEIREIWEAAEVMKGTDYARKADSIGRKVPTPSQAAFGRLVQFLLLTAQRRNEGAAIRHGNVLDGNWTITDNKADRPHRLKLPAMAVELLGNGNARDLCFTGKTGKISGFAALKRKIDKLAGVKGWVLHDLRRTARTMMQEDLNIDFWTCEAILNHAIPGVAGNYMHGELKAQKEKALAVWADHVAHIVGKRAGVVRKAA